MKKVIKKIGALLVLTALVFSLCGCSALDLMRQQQIFVEEDGSFYYNDIHYVKLDANEYFSPVGDYTGFFNLTQPDVPVLLSNDFQEGSLRFTEDGRFCRDYRRGLWFCRADILEEIQAKNKEPFVPDTLYYEYSYYDRKTQEYTLCQYFLSAQELAAVQAVLDSEPVELGDGMYLSYDWGFSLTAATADLLFCHEGPSIFQAGNTYYLEVYQGEGSSTYRVPEEYNALFANLTNKWNEAFTY